MVQDVRSSSTSFDLLTQEGIMRALAAVRASAASPESKRELRDLLFSYTSSGGDPALRSLIESQLVALAVVGDQVSATVQESSPDTESVPASTVVSELVHDVLPAPVLSTTDSQTTPPSYSPASAPAAPTILRGGGFGTGRLAPQFVTPPAPTLVSASQPVSAPSQVPLPAAVLTTEPSTPVTPSSVAHEPADIPHKAPALHPTPDPLPVAMVSKSVVDEKLAVVAPVSGPTIEYKPPYREDASLEAYRARIAEIKQLVNTKVGNPVNLVDIDNVVGRNYMTALLEAMKAASGGGGDIVSLMARLEAVLVEVEALLQKKQVTPVATATPDTPDVPTAALASVVSEAVSVPTVLPVSASPAPVSLPVTEVEMVPITPMTIASSRFKNVLPVAAQEPLKTPADLPTASDVKARSGIVDPLQDPDVDQGLEQLLGEWSLFKKSGMFGTGPRGRQHPLFLKLAAIPMPLILSGRFEGSSTEIRQSITDYMNGWRYEQGIIYEQDETFEHYLRRVIRHIIDFQSRRRGA